MVGSTRHRKGSLLPISGLFSVANESEVGRVRGRRRKKTMNVKELNSIYDFSTDLAVFTAIGQQITNKSP